MEIVLASRNRKKIEELVTIIEATGLTGSDEEVKILTPDMFAECAEVEEDGDTFEANAIKKARYVSECTGLNAIADDSGIEVDALDGRPGVYSARYAGNDANDRNNLEKLLAEMSNVPPGRRNARFVCCIALSTKKGIRTFSGFVEGTIAMDPAGDNGFGYDPVFIPEGHERTFAQMSDRGKNSMSHRGRALQKLQDCLAENKELLKD